MELSNNNPNEYTFELLPGVRREKVSFKNRFGIELVGDLYLPESLKDGESITALAISGPYGAVKEQASGYYANQLAARGYMALAFDPSFTGESSGEPRYVSSPDINTEDFQAAIDYLWLRKDADNNRLGILGICGWGGIAINAAAVETRVKATIAVTMYDMHRVNANGYFDQNDSAEARHAMLTALNAQRSNDFACGEYRLGGGVVDPLPADAPQFVKDYYDYYKTPRGYAKRSLNSNNGWNMTNSLSWINTPIMAYAGEIRSALMVLHGEKAHSLYFGKDAFALLKGENKKLVIVPNASHCDLYDGGPNHDMIPFDIICDFYSEYLK